LGGGGSAQAGRQDKGVKEMNVLVAYASKYGSTREIANRIAWQLRQPGMQAQARPVQELDDLVDYDAFVVGSAVFAGHWIPEAMDFVRRNRALLAHGPVWLFSSAPIGATAKQHDTPAEPKELAELRRALRPWDHRVFFGAWDPSRLDRRRLGLAERLIAKVLPKGDFRDWQAIEAWATSIARALQDQPTEAR